jgi:glycosyltransferase involved in cell wall biosynthesis
VTNQLADKVVGIIIPAFNPLIQHLKELIHRLKKMKMSNPVEILIVDDGSSTPINKNDFSEDIHIRRHTINKGKGAALKTGFNHFLKNDSVLLVITIDADLQHPPEKISDFIKAYESGKGQLIVGYRRRALSIMPFHRIFSNMSTSLIISVLTGQLIKDSQNGFRLLSKEVLREVHLKEDGFQMESEMLIKAGWKDFRIGFVSMPTIYSLEKSSINNVKDTLNFILLILKFLKERLFGCTTIN